MSDLAQRIERLSRRSRERREAAQAEAIEKRVLADAELEKKRQQMRELMPTVAAVVDKFAMFEPRVIYAEENGIRIVTKAAKYFGVVDG